MTLSPSLTDWLAPALATGASLSALIVTVTVSVATFLPSVTETSKVTVELTRPSGAANDGCADLASLSVTAGPEVCVQV